MMNCCHGGKKDITTVIKVEGMTCGHCAMTVKKGLAELTQVKGVDVSLEDGAVSITHTDDLCLDEVTEKITKLGYKVV